MHNKSLVFSSSGPNGKTVPVQKSKLRGLTYTITADEVGEHVIQVLVNGQHIKGSPFRFAKKNLCTSLSHDFYLSHVSSSKPLIMS